MALVVSPVSENVLESVPHVLFPRTGFLMRQVGDPSNLDTRLADLVSRTLESEGYGTIDATDTTAAKDFLARIVELIRATGYTVAVFSEQTRPAALASIMLELGFAAMLGKPLMIVKSKAVAAPSNLTRTDRIEYDPHDETTFEKSLRQAAKELQRQGSRERELSEIALQARSMDCVIAFERVQKAFLLSGDARCVIAARAILEKLDGVSGDEEISGLERLRSDVRAFVRQAEAARGNMPACPS